MDLSVDKTAFRVASLDAPSDDPAHWRARSPAERLEALETMRQILYGYDPATARLQRVLEITDCR